MTTGFKHPTKPSQNRRDLPVEFARGGTNASMTVEKVRKRRARSRGEDSLWMINQRYILSIRKTKLTRELKAVMEPNSKKYAGTDPDSKP